MTDIPDRELLSEFARNESEGAFTELVRRHIALVHSVAWRHTDNPQSAQEITQAVFIILARKAAALGRGTVLSGWLHQTARLTAANFRRAEFRRIHREQEAFMQSTIEEAAPDPAWAQLAPMLDEAVAHLGATDRAAVVLFYFENKSLAEVGAALGTSEDAAKKRVARAVEKLRKFFTRRGVALSAAAIAGVVSANSVQAAPVGMAAKVSVLAAKGVAATTSISALVKGTLKTMAWTKSKIAIAVVVTGLLVFSACLVARYSTTEPKQVLVLEISGIIKQTIYYAEANKFQTNKNYFTVKIWDDKARIETGPMDDPSLSGFEYGMLGKDSYLLIRLVPGLMATEVYQLGSNKPTKLKVPVKSENDANLTINDGEVPEYSFGLISPVWMAYCFHLGRTNVNQTMAQLPPIFSMGSPFRTAKEIADTSYTLNRKAPFMLQTLTEYGDPDQIKALALLTKEIFTNAIYQVLTWTNVGGNTVAQQFQVNNTFIGSRAGVIITRSIVCEGVATNIVVRTEPAPQIQVSKNTRVTEHRSKMVAPLDSFSYLSKDGRLLTRDKILKNSEYKDQLSEH